MLSGPSMRRETKQSTCFLRFPLQTTPPQKRAGRLAEVMMLRGGEKLGMVTFNPSRGRQISEFPTCLVCLHRESRPAKAM